MKRKLGLLPQVPFAILMALSLKARHGYEIMQQVEEDSLGKVTLGPGALYSSIKQLVDDGLIEEIDGHNERRRYYQLTKKGWERFSSELAYFENVARIGRQRTAAQTNTFYQGI